MKIFTQLPNLRSENLLGYNKITNYKLLVELSLKQRKLSEEIENLKAFNL